MWNRFHIQFHAFLPFAAAGGEQAHLDVARSHLDVKNHMRLWPVPSSQHSAALTTSSP